MSRGKRICKGDRRGAKMVQELKRQPNVSAVWKESKTYEEFREWSIQPCQCCSYKR